MAAVKSATANTVIPTTVRPVSNNQKFVAKNTSAQSSDVIDKIIKDFLWNAEKNTLTTALKKATRENARFTSELEGLSEKIKKDAESITTLTESITKLEEEEKSNKRFLDIFSKVCTTISNASKPAFALTLYFGVGAVKVIIPGFIGFIGSAADEPLSAPKEPALKKAKDAPEKVEEETVPILEREWFKTCQNLTKEHSKDTSSAEFTALSALLDDVFCNDDQVNSLKEVSKTTTSILQRCIDEQERLTKEINDSSPSNIFYQVFNNGLIKITGYLPSGETVKGTLIDVASKVASGAKDYLDGVKKTPEIASVATSEAGKRLRENSAPTNTGPSDGNAA